MFGTSRNHPLWRLETQATESDLENALAIKADPVIKLHLGYRVGIGLLSISEIIGCKITMHAHLQSSLGPMVEKQDISVHSK